MGGTNPQKKGTNDHTSGHDDSKKIRAIGKQVPWLDERLQITTMPWLDERLQATTMPWLGPA